jgi:hypothetical protein
MTESKLAQARSLADQLGPADQARLVAYLAARLALAVAPLEIPPAASQTEAAEAWQRLWKIGEEISQSDTSTGESLTSAVLSMRR